MTRHPAAQASCFTPFDKTIDTTNLPHRFTYPFNYEPHPLCRVAATMLQQFLVEQTDWHHDFGIEHHVEGTNVGKMFGVLIARDQAGVVGYLWAFSGKLAGSNHLPRFVPPVADLLQEDGFYRRGEDYISKINKKIQTIEESADYLHYQQHARQLREQSTREIEEFRSQMKAAKKARDIARANAEGLPGNDCIDQLKERLKNESLRWQFDYKQLAKAWRETLDRESQPFEALEIELNQLKDERRTLSAQLQQQMFDQYQFLDPAGQSRGVRDIFTDAGLTIPPAGAGDCAAPKLLQYAYQHQLNPLAMAEFWWGQSPSSEIRQHGNFYPSCRGKCEPILGHMLRGLATDPNPVLLQQHDRPDPQVIHEDEHLLVINKPAEYLSVPGKTGARSVLDFARERCPEATGPLIVHRLDMSTSGLMVIAKTTSAYHHLQAQFAAHTVVKRYHALLDGILESNQGVIDLPLRVDLENRPCQLVCYQHGKPARTLWTVLQRRASRTLVAFTPVTGRTHQLRVHAAHQLGLHCPIVGDDLYGTRADRLHLHAQFLQFTHPGTGVVVSFQSTIDF